MSRAASPRPSEGNQPRERRRLWWEAFNRVAWETGLRQGDLLSLEWRQLDDDGTLHAVQLKDGMEVSLKLSPETVAAVRALRRPDDRLVFTSTGRSVPAEWKSLLQRAGVGHGSLGGLGDGDLAGVDGSDQFGGAFVEHCGCVVNALAGDGDGGGGGGLVAGTWRRLDSLW